MLWYRSGPVGCHGPPNHPCPYLPDQCLVLLSEASHTRKVSVPIYELRQPLLFFTDRSVVRFLNLLYVLELVLYCYKLNRETYNHVLTSPSYSQCQGVFHVRPRIVGSCCSYVRMASVN